MCQQGVSGTPPPAHDGNDSAPGGHVDAGGKGLSSKDSLSRSITGWLNAAKGNAAVPTAAKPGGLHAAVSPRLQLANDAGFVLHYTVL